MRSWRITKRGAIYTRWELLKNGRPSGEPFRGPRHTLVDGKYVPRGDIALVTYRTGDVVKLTEQGARNLRHLGLEPHVPIIGQKVEAVTATELSERHDEATNDGAESIVVPDDWRDLPADARKKLASKIAGTRIKTVTMANKIIEEHVS